MVIDEPVIRCALIVSIWVLGACSLVTGAVAVVVIGYTPLLACWLSINARISLFLNSKMPLTFDGLINLGGSACHHRRNVSGLIPIKVAACLIRICPSGWIARGAWVLPVDWVMLSNS